MWLLKDNEYILNRAFLEYCDNFLNYQANCQVLLKQKKCKDEISIIIGKMS